MKAGALHNSAFLLVCISSTLLSSLAAEFPVQLRAKGTGVELSWPTSVNDGQGAVYPEYQVEFSSDLVQWHSVAGRFRGVEGRSGPRLSLSFSKEPGAFFYR